MLRSHNCGLYASNNPRQSYIERYEPSHILPNANSHLDHNHSGDASVLVESEALIPKERIYIRRVYNGITSAANMADEVVVEKVIERRISYGRGGFGNMRKTSFSSSS